MVRSFCLCKTSSDLVPLYADKDTPKYVKAVIAGALGYLVLPIDIVPDTIPVLGWIDDVAVFGLAFKVCQSLH